MLSLEASEKLEQLRYLEYGKRIKMVETSHGSIGIDTPEDLEKARTEANSIRKEMAEARKEVEREVTQLKREVDAKIQKAIDNPLANK